MKLNMTKQAVKGLYAIDTQKFINAIDNLTHRYKYKD